MSSVLHHHHRCLSHFSVPVNHFRPIRVPRSTPLTTIVILRLPLSIAMAAVVADDVATRGNNSPIFGYFSVVVGLCCSPLPTYSPSRGPPIPKVGLTCRRAPATRLVPVCHVTLAQPAIASTQPRLHLPSRNHVRLACICVCPPAITSA